MAYNNSSLHIPGAQPTHQVQPKLHFVEAHLDATVGYVGEDRCYGWYLGQQIQ